MQPGPYNELKALVRERDRVCRKAYRKYMLCDIPSGDVEVHHVIPRTAGRNDVETNLISLSYTQHRFEFHSDNAEIKKAAAERAKAYLTSKRVEAWREANAKRIKEIYSRAEEAEARKKKRDRETHSKWDPPGGSPKGALRVAGCWRITKT